MLLLSRKIDQEYPESINLHVDYSKNKHLVRIIESLGGHVHMLKGIVDTITVTPIRGENILGLKTNQAVPEVVLGFEAPQNVRILRSEIDQW
jgi:sRNA-binding carbon storage regulator CsrA